MALFKILRGNSSKLFDKNRKISKDVPFNDGYCYFTPDNKKFYIDWLDKSNGEQHRDPLNSSLADILLSSWTDINNVSHTGKAKLVGFTSGEAEIHNSNEEIPTSAVLYAKFSDIENALAALGKTYVLKSGDTMTGNLTAPAFIGSLQGNADTATKLATAKTISLTGSVTGSGSFDGSGNLNIDTTTNHTHNYAGSSSVGGGSKTLETFHQNSTTQTYGTSWNFLAQWITNDRLKFKVINNGTFQNYPIEVDHAYKLVDSSTDKNSSVAPLSIGSSAQPVYFSGGKPVACTLTASDIGAAPASRTINGKALSSDITLSKSDVGLGNVDNVKQYSASNPPPSIIEQNKGLPQKFWRGTKAEYDTIETKSDDTMYIIIDDESAYIPSKPKGKSYLTFSSPNSFTLKVNNAKKNWDGTLEYFSSDKIWTTWDGTITLSSIENDDEYVLYLRGTGNTVITGNSPNYRLVFTGSNISCIGNIETLLDYATVESGNHPTMAAFCYTYMFYGCTSLTQAPTLLATTLASNCYDSMFYNCASLTQAPALPATTLADYCYWGMFRGCTSLIQAPILPSTSLNSHCYYYMFYGCKNLTQAPALPATTLADYCYSNMFYGCTSLTQAPALPATTLADHCYSDMFSDCTSLIQAPALPAITLANSCYSSMFLRCFGLTHAPTLPATTLASNCYSNMFSYCTSLTQVPALPSTTLADYCYNRMFYNCISIKLSSIQTGEYTQGYRIPTSGTGTTAINAFTDMFTSTGGTFTGTPEINTTYYLSIDNMVVRENDIATLNGYVGSMIEAKTNTSSFYIGVSAPSNTNLLWIDTDTSAGGLKYYNGSAWVHVPVAYT